MSTTEADPSLYTIAIGRAALAMRGKFLHDLWAKVALDTVAESTERDLLTRVHPDVSPRPPPRHRIYRCLGRSPVFQLRGHSYQLAAWDSAAHPPDAWPWPDQECHLTFRRVPEWPRAIAPIEPPENAATS